MAIISPWALEFAAETNIMRNTVIIRRSKDSGAEASGHGMPGAAIGAASKRIHASAAPSLLIRRYSRHSRYNARHGYFAFTITGCRIATGQRATGRSRGGGRDRLDQCRPAGAAGTVVVAAAAGGRKPDCRARSGRAQLAFCARRKPDFFAGLAFGRPLQSLLGLPLAVGVALAEALAALDVPVALKWPNDVLKDGKKLAGILLETVALPATEPGGQGGTWVVIGVGMNLSMPDRLEAQIGHAVADAPWLARMDRSRLLAALLNALADVLSQFEEGGFKPFMPRWNSLHAYAGQTVLILDHGKVLQQGRAVGVDQSGCLLLDTAAGRIAVVAGDVSLRVKEN